MVLKQILWFLRKRSERASDLNRKIITSAKAEVKINLLWSLFKFYVVFREVNGNRFKISWINININIIYFNFFKLLYTKEN